MWGILCIKSLSFLTTVREIFTINLMIQRENWGPGDLENWPHNKSVAESGLKLLHTLACLTRFFGVITVNTLGWIILCWRGGQWGEGRCRCYPGYGRMFNSIAGLCPRDASSISWLVPAKSLPTLPDDLWEAKPWPVENHWCIGSIAWASGCRLKSERQGSARCWLFESPAQLPSSCCSPHRPRSPWNWGDVPTWNNPTHWTTFCFPGPARTHCQFSPGWWASAPEGGSSVSAEWGGGMLNMRTMRFGRKHARRAPPMKDGGGGGKERMADHRQASLESWLSPQVCGWPLQTLTAGVVVAHTVLTHPCEDLRVTIFANRKSLLGLRFSPEIHIFSREIVTVFLTWWSFLTKKRQHFFFFFWKSRKESKRNKDTLRGGAQPGSVTSRGGPHPQQPSGEGTVSFPEEIMAPPNLIPHKWSYLYHFYLGNHIEMTSGYTWSQPVWGGTVFNAFRITPSKSLPIILINGSL